MALSIDSSATNSVSASSSATVTLSTSNTADVVVVFISSTGTATVSGVTDSTGLTWAKRQSKNGTTIAIEEWWAVAASALSSAVITATFGTAHTGARMTAVAVSGAHTPSPFDVDSSLPAQHSSTVSTSEAVTISTVVANTILLLADRINAGYGTITRPSGFTQVLATGTVNEVCSKIVSSAETNATKTLSWTTTSTENIMLFDALQISTTALLSGTATTNYSGNTTASVTVANATGGTSPYTYQWYRSTSTGFTPGAGNIVVGATSQTLNDTGLTNGTTYYYKCVVTDTVLATANSNQTSALPSVLSVGTVSLTSTGDGAVTVACTAATGGNGSYTYQWYRAAVSNFTPGAGNLMSGATSLSFADTGLTNNTVYYYRLIANDGTDTATSKQISGVPAEPVYIGVIGDSWTTATCLGGGTGNTAIVSVKAAGSLVANQLEALFQDGTNVTGVNAGVGGTNAVDWAGGGSDMNAAVSAFNAVNATAADWTILVHLGINDANLGLSTPAGGETKAQYKTAMTNICTYLLNTYGASKIVLIGPPAIQDLSTNTTAYSLLLKTQYNDAVTEIAAAYPGQVYASMSEFDYITNKWQTVLGDDHVHPTPANSNGQGGAVYMATIWAKALYDAIRPASSGSSGSSGSGLGRMSIGI